MSKLEQNIRQKVNQVHFEPGEHLWGQIEANIPPPPKKKRRGGWLWFLGLGLGLTSLILVSRLNSSSVHAGRIVLDNYQPSNVILENPKTLKSSFEVHTSELDNSTSQNISLPSKDIIETTTSHDVDLSSTSEKPEVSEPIEVPNEKSESPDHFSNEVPEHKNNVEPSELLLASKSELLFSPIPINKSKPLAIKAAENLAIGNSILDLPDANALDTALVVDQKWAASVESFIPAYLFLELEGVTTDSLPAHFHSNFGWSVGMHGHYAINPNLELSLGILFEHVASHIHYNRNFNLSQDEYSFPFDDQVRFQIPLVVPGNMSPSQFDLHGSASFDGDSSTIIRADLKSELRYHFHKMRVPLTLEYRYKQGKLGIGVMGGLSFVKTFYSSIHLENFKLSINGNQAQISSLNQPRLSSGSAIDGLVGATIGFDITDRFTLSAEPKFHFPIFKNNSETIRHFESKVLGLGVRLKYHF